MFNIVDNTSRMFGNTAYNSIEEVLYRFSISYRIQREKLPTYEKLISFFGNIEDQDDGIITFTGESDQTLSVDIAVSEEEYNVFLDNLVQDEEVNASVRILKKVENSTLSVYNLDLFTDFMKGLSVTDLFSNFTELFSLVGDHLRFKVIDKSCLLQTPTSVFSDEDVSWNEEKSRHEMLENCFDASIFFQKTEYAVIPQDFEVMQSSTECEEIAQLFSRLCSILSYVYLANTASIMGDKVVLQFDPRKPGEAYAINELEINSWACRIYKWVYKDSNCVDKAGIARGIINVYCKTRADILYIGEPIYNSIKSDYVIYQKNHAEAYIEMKNRISDFILDTGKQIQELTDNLTDGLKNNFLAVIGFALTVVLSDSIDVKVWVEADVSLRVIGICTLFTISSICYLVVTIISNNSKWTWIERNYSALKRNYKGALDEADIQEAFGNDVVKEEAHTHYKKNRLIVSVIWVVIILVMGSFTFLMSRPLTHNNKEVNSIEESGKESDDEVPEPSENDSAASEEDSATESHNELDMMNNE